MTEYARQRVAQYPMSIALDGTGAGSDRFTNNNSASQFVVVQAALITNPVVSGGCTCKLFQNAFLIGTSYFAGTGDAFVEPPAQYLDPGEYLTFTFAGGPPNGQGLVTIYYVEVT